MAKLHHYRLCPQSRAARMLLGELRMPFDLVDEKPWEWSPERARLSPSGDLPIYVDEATGDVIAGSYPLTEYLAERAQIGIVLPGDIIERSELRRLIDWYHGTCLRTVTAPLLEAKVYHRFRGADATAPDPGELRAVRSNLKQQLRYLEYLTGDRHWLGGERLSAADFAAAGHISVLDYLGEIDWTEVPKARIWYARMKSRPAVRPILLERVPGAAPPPAHYADPDF